MEPLTFGNTKPIDPQHCHPKIPDYVFEVFNFLLEKNINSAGVATIELRDATTLLSKRIDYDTKWLNIEEHYRKAGWKVKFVKPDIDQLDFEPFYEFSKN